MKKPRQSPATKPNIASRQLNSLQQLRLFWAMQVLWALWIGLKKKKGKGAVHLL
jgi:hypothetical protein